jgi:hypothetical protein
MPKHGLGSAGLRGISIWHCPPGFLSNGSTNRPHMSRHQGFITDVLIDLLGSGGKLVLPGPISLAPLPYEASSH